MMRNWSFHALVVAAALASAAPAHAEVSLTMRDGKVSIKANNATVREILAEWASVGHARIINGELIGGGPITLELTDVTERQALDVLLRSVAGYIVAPRSTAVPTAARYDRVLILPASAAPHDVAPVPAPPISSQPPFDSTPPPDDYDDPMDADEPDPGDRIFNTFTRPVQPNLQLNNLHERGPSQPAPATSPWQGVAVPGMIVQPPPQPGRFPQH